MHDRPPIAGRYRLESKLGSGGMGDVWRARDEFLGRVVAVKEVRPPEGLDAAKHAEFCERLLSEARAAAALPHPSIITVHDVLRQDGRPWIVMDLIDGPSLEAVRTRQGPLPPRRVAEIGLQLLDALLLAHSRGIAHRDVKPANVLLSGDRAILTDFGIATVAGDPGAAAEQGIVGSPGYMAPERLGDGPVNGLASDLWSLGATLYTAVEGRRPYERPNALAMIGAVLTEDAETPRLAGPLGPLLLAMLHRDPHRRPAPAEIRRTLEGAAGVVPAPMAFSPPQAAPPGFPPTVPMAGPSAGRSGAGALLAVGAGVAAVVMVAVAAGAFFVLRGGDGDRPPTGGGPSSAPPAAGGTPAPADPDAAPEPCALLTEDQARTLIGDPEGTAANATTCTWGDADDKLEITFRVLPEQNGKSAEQVAKDTYALRKRQAAGEAGTSSEPAIKVVTTRPQDLPGVGDEAFAQSETSTGSFGDTATTTVHARSGPLLLQLTRSGPSTLAESIRDTALQAARHALDNLTP
ncbi:serine/threonine protein kinase [Actinocorallia herbida]|uniref:non-specific serine/threonine protein kinase n=1 Tax=Actinocorallia herbida TaxID=58109 RepID=A0A3N1CYU4_9ACTN|nr:serine/threonine-protein kinase [Actinocorallia herbida]ROO86440.1 serine/threonine protein kinase [Actinocorallia herbida]